MLQVESEKQELIVTYLKDLRDQIIQGFEGFEKEKYFQKKPGIIMVVVAEKSLFFMEMFLKKLR